jgi:HK97 family phage prohead protease
LFEDGVVFREVVKPDAFDNVLNSKELDVLATYNHDNTRLLGRLNKMSGANTLELTPTERGLKSRVEIPDTPTANEVYTLVERGDLDEASFVFTVDEEGQSWDFSEEPALRTIKSVTGLYDVSVVHKGAYAGGAVTSARAAYDEAYEAQVEKPIKEIEAAEKEAKRIVDTSIEHDEMTIKLRKLKQPKGN